MWCGSHSGLGWAGWTLMSIGMVAFWGLIVWVVVTLVRPDRTVQPRKPIAVLVDRLAKGEITAEEYERARELVEREARASRADDETEARQ